MVGHAQFELAPRGDTPSTQRLYDAVQYGAIPIFISDQIFRVGLPFQCFVPYRRFVLSVREVKMARAAPDSLAQLLNGTSARRRQRMRKLLRWYRRDLLWNFPDSRVPENTLLEAARLRGVLPRGTCCWEDARREKGSAVMQWDATFSGIGEEWKRPWQTKV